MTPERIVLASPRAVADRAADMTEQLAKERIEKSGRFTLALSGGSTPKLYHRALQERPLEWSKVHVLFSDERAVPATHEHSNHRMAQETLLDGLKTQVHRIDADDGDTERAAAAYESVIKELGLDLVMLGMGGDGHTASLFPGRDDVSGLVAAVTAPPSSPIERRVTFTYDAIASARCVIFLITGEGKKDRLCEVLNTKQLPASKVLERRSGETFILCDEAAAGELKK